MIELTRWLYHHTAQKYWTFQSVYIIPLSIRELTYNGFPPPRFNAHYTKFVINSYLLDDILDVIISRPRIPANTLLLITKQPWTSMSTNTHAYTCAYLEYNYLDFCARFLLRYFNIKIISAPAVTALPRVRLVVNLLSAGAILSRSTYARIAPSWCNGQTVAR